VAVTREEVSPQLVEEQRRIFLKQAEDKPEQIRAKIAEGKLNSWFAESVLLDQVFVKDSAKTVREVILEVNARVGENISVARFARFIVGDSAPAEAANAEA
jgi:elongation factor Ts